MEYEEKLTEVRNLAFETAKQLHGRRLKSDLRSRVSAACFAIAQQHHSAILLMLSNRPPLEATAFALLRPLLEATMRGLWLSHCATDEQVENFVSPTRKQLDAASIQLAIDKTVANGSAHTAIYKKHWSALSAYTHTGEHQVQRWLTTKDVEPAYSTAEVSELIKLAGLTMQLTASAVMALRSADVE